MFSYVVEKWLNIEQKFHPKEFKLKWKIIGEFGSIIGKNDWILNKFSPKKN